MQSLQDKYKIYEQKNASAEIGGGEKTNRETTSSW